MYNKWILTWSPDFSVLTGIFVRAFFAACKSRLCELIKFPEHIKTCTYARITVQLQGYDGNFSCVLNTSALAGRALCGRFYLDYLLINIHN